ncbi:MAG: ferrochelatase [Bryobacteraceae bacterium]
MASEKYDALLVVSFGGPEKHDDVIPFLENVLRGRNVPRERMLEVAEHYYHFEGRSPINDHAKELISALEPLVPMPIYWGNRNWHPMLTDTVRKMKDDGVRRALALATSAFGSYSSCRQYQDNLDGAVRAVGEGAPRIDKIQPFWDGPGFTAAMADHIRPLLTPDAELIFTAHSIPTSMAQTSPYEGQIREASARVAAELAHPRWTLVWQSRSGPPSQPWLEPDVVDYIRARPDQSPIVIAPIGFLSDHVEVLWDLDHDAREACVARGISMKRAAAVGTNPKFVAMLAELVRAGAPAACPGTCCPAPVRPAMPQASTSHPGSRPR